MNLEPTCILSGGNERSLRAKLDWGAQVREKDLPHHLRHQWQEQIVRQLKPEWFLLWIKTSQNFCYLIQNQKFKGFLTNPIFAAYNCLQEGLVGFGVINSYNKYKLPWNEFINI